MVLYSIYFRSSIIPSPFAFRIAIYSKPTVGTAPTLQQANPKIKTQDNVMNQWSVKQKIELGYNRSKQASSES